MSAHPSVVPGEISDFRAAGEWSMSGNAETYEMINEASQTMPEGRARRTRAGIAQYPVQILIPEETRNALRQRSADTGASIRHIILRSLAADGFPVPKGNRRLS